MALKLNELIVTNAINASITGNAATATTAANGGVTSVSAGTGIGTSASTGAVTITNSSPNATHTGDVTGATALTIANDAVTTVKILNANVTNVKLANSSLTIGSTAISLGGTVTTFAGLASVTSTAFVGALTGNATTATALTSMNISQFTNNSGYLTSAVTSLAGTTNRITVSGATGAVTLNLPQDIHTSASPTFSGLSLTSVSTTGATITNLTGAYQNTTVYDSPRTQSATPSRGIRSPASSIQFTDSYAIAPFYTYRSTGDWPVPYGIGWGTGGESSGIFQRYASNGSSFGDMIFYTGNDGSGAFSFRRHTWEGTTYFAAGSGELNTELFRIDWAGKATATSFALPGGFTITDPGSGYAAFSNWVLLGTTGFYSSTNSAHLHPNTGTYGSWKITGTRGGWHGIEFESGTILMANSSESGFYRVGSGWQMWWSGGTGYVQKGGSGGGTQATILESSNYTSYTPGLGTNNTLTAINTINNSNNTVINNQSGNLGLTMYQATTGTDAYMTFHISGDFAAYFGLGGAENDLVYGGWSVGNVRHRILHSGNAPYAWNMNQYVRTTDTCSFAALTVSNTITGAVSGNAGTATILQTARNINGTSFNGSAAITTATWGTARTLTIGSTGKSVDGSAAITWSLAEIGAAATNQTMFVGTTSVAINRASAGQTLTGVNIDGNAGSADVATYARRVDGATRTSFTVGGNKDNYYPVIFNIGSGATALQYSEFVIERGGYEEPGYTFAGGNTFSTLNIRFSCKSSGWGYGATYENVEMHGYTTQLVANWQQMSEASKLIVWLRGATIYYFWNVVGNTTLDNGNSGGTSLTLANPSYYSYTYTSTQTVQTKALYGKYVNSSTGTSGIYVAGNVLAEGLFSGPGTGLTGTASSLSIGGNAATATILQTARNINGTSFNGSADITTATWGTARTLTIGSTGKSVDGSAAITWSLAEIGAAATNQTMFIGTTSVAINRASANLALTGITSIDGNAATVTNATFYRQFTVRDDRSDGGNYSLSARATGLYAIDAAGTNGPGATYLSLIHVSNGTDVAFQIAGGYVSDNMYFRGTSALQNGTGYSAWRTVVHSGNIASQTVATAGNATTAGGLSVHGGTNNEANKIVRTDGNGYINAGWINTPSGDMPDTQSINRIYCSDDQYIRYKGVADFKQQIGLTYKNATPRSSNTTDTNYWTGIMGWTTTDFNTMITWGCGFIDSWASPGNSPGAGYTHFVGVQALHYTNGDTDGTDNYGYQLVAGNGVNSPLFLRVNWGSAGSWKTMLDSLNFNSYSPSLTGNGASGTWSINVTGNAGTATTSLRSTIEDTRAAQRTPNDYDDYRASYEFTNAITGLGDWHTAFTLQGWHNGYAAWQIIGPASTSAHENFYLRSGVNTTWNSVRTILHSGNYNSYSPTLTGTGASGTWAINITGNAATATTATNVTIANGSVTLAKIENITAYTILGNSNASAVATPAALSVATVATMLSGQTMNINGSSTSISGFNNPTTAASGNTIVYRDGSGHITGNYIFGSYLNSTDNVDTGTITNIVAKFGDNYHRSATAAKVAAFITGQTMNINGSSTSCSGNAATATNVAASGITGQTGMWTSAARPGPYRLYRRDSDDDYSVQNYWTGVYWRLDGYYSNNTLHAGCSVSYADTAGTANALTTGNTYQVANLGIGVAASNRLHINGDGVNPTIRIDNTVFGTGSSSSRVFFGWLPISINVFGTVTTKYIQLYNS